MAYKVTVTKEALRDLDYFISYLIFDKANAQAAASLLDDFEETTQTLSQVAGSLQYCDNPRLRRNGYRRINFLSHRYFMLYRIENDMAIVDNIFHELQDYENKLS